MIMYILYTLLSTVVAVLYPAFMSFKAIKAGKNSRQWLEYWAVYALFSVVEFFVLDNLISSLPLYYLCKLSFVGWLAVMDGASTLYKNVLEKLLVQHEASIDIALEQAYAQVSTKLLEGKEIVLDLTKKHAGSIYDVLVAGKSTASAAPSPAPSKPKSSKAE
mmetsp:Transcript_17663/g.45659  ORF Transcript_17663/g.45659 Transcript_17663/m.45659 type:complete len:162 (-) Transcript_17663:42-527(-)